MNINWQNVIDLLETSDPKGAYQKLRAVQKLHKYENIRCQVITYEEQNINRYLLKGNYIEDNLEIEAKSTYDRLLIRENIFAHNTFVINNESSFSIISKYGQINCFGLYVLELLPSNNQFEESIIFNLDDEEQLSDFIKYLQEMNIAEIKKQEQTLYINLHKSPINQQTFPLNDFPDFISSTEKVFHQVPAMGLTVNSLSNNISINNSSDDFQWNGQNGSLHELGRIEWDE